MEVENYEKECRRLEIAEREEQLQHQKRMNEIEYNRALQEKEDHKQYLVIATQDMIRNNINTLCKAVLAGKGASYDFVNAARKQLGDAIPQLKVN